MTERPPWHPASHPDPVASPRAEADAPAVALAACGVSVRAGAWPILHDVSVALRAGRWCAIVGPNGAGKSTLLKALAGVRPVSSGQISLLGRPWADWPVRERARRLVWLGQNESAADDLRVRDVAMLGRLPHQGWLAPPSADDQMAVDAALRAVRVEGFVDRTLGQLSGGERQRVLLARALATGADVVLMDEPLANLDPPHQADWVGLVRALVGQGRTVVSVLHELSVALLADDLLIMREGRVAHYGASRDARTQRALEAVFEQRVVVRSMDGHPVVLPRIVLDGQ